MRQPPPAGAASFSATYIGPAGWGYDPGVRQGLARMANHLVTTAAGPYDRVALARKLDRAGATLSRDASPEAAEVTIWGPARDWRSLLALLSEVVLEPRFDPDDLARVRRQMLERHLRERNDPGHRAAFELRRAVFPPGHPYRATGLGEPGTVGRVRRTDLHRFHRDHYTGRGGSVVVTVPASLTAVERAVRDRFGSIPGPGPPRLRIPRIPRAAPTRVTVDLPGRSEVEMVVGGPSIPQSSPLYPGAFLANETLGGRPLLSRLFQRVRERSGLAYHASSHLETLRWAGFWSARAGAGADRWRKVVPMLEEEVARLRRKAIPRAELAAIRESAIGEIPLSLESTSDAHALAVESAYLGLPPDFWLTWPERLRAVTPRDVQHAATAAFDRNHSATVAVGPLRPA